MIDITLGKLKIAQDPGINVDETCKIAITQLSASHTLLVSMS